MQQASSPASVPASGSDLDDSRPIRLAWFLILGVTAFRALYASIYTFDLAGDEAYYWDWGRRLDWGYFSKPPLIAWLMRAVTEIGGNHTLTIRLASALFGAGSLCFLLLFSKALFGNRAALWTVLLSIALPANVFLSAMLTIDSPLIFFWSASLLLFWRLLEGRQPIVSALLLSITLGLGYLSKQMMLVFPLLAIIYLATLTDREKRRAQLRNPLVWAAIGLSLCFTIPNLLWNARNGWIMFAHTSGQITGEGDSEPFGLPFLTFLGTQAGILSPLIWFMAMATAFGGLLSFRSLGDLERFLVLFSAPAFVVMYVMSLGRVMLPNWPAVYYVAAIVLVAGWITENATIPGVRTSWRRLARPALWVGFIMVALVYLLPLVLDLTGLTGHQKLDPFRRVRGHQAAALQAAAFLEKVPRPDQTIIMGQGHRYHASHLAFYLPGQPRVYRWERWNHIASQYELWPTPLEDGKTGWDALVFLPDRDRNIPYRFEGGFEKFEKLGDIEVEISPHYEKTYQVFLGQRFHRWPPPLLLEEKAAREAANEKAVETEE